jgi:predicted amidohydrolase YtcJ
VAYFKVKYPGSLEVGKEADFIILNQNIFDLSSNQISQTKVTQTYFKGELIYEL